MKNNIKIEKDLLAEMEEVMDDMNKNELKAAIRILYQKHPNTLEFLHRAKISSFYYCTQNDGMCPGMYHKPEDAEAEIGDCECYPNCPMKFEDNSWYQDRQGETIITT